MELELPSLHTAPVRSWVSTVGTLLVILYPGITVFGFPKDYEKVPYLTPAASPLASFLPSFYPSQCCSEELLIDVNGEPLTSAAPVFPAPGLGRWLQEPSRCSGTNLSVRQLTSHGAARQVGKQRWRMCSFRPSPRAGDADVYLHGSLEGLCRIEPTWSSAGVCRPTRDLPSLPALPPATVHPSQAPGVTSTNNCLCTNPVSGSALPAETPHRQVCSTRLSQRLY